MINSNYNIFGTNEWVIEETQYHLEMLIAELFENREASKEMVTHHIEEMSKILNLNPRDYRQVKEENLRGNYVE